jgi:hypothetical protein
MKTIIYILSLHLALTPNSCQNTKNIVAKKQSSIDAIEIALADFPINKRLYKKDSVFSIQLVGLRNNENIIVVRISKNSSKLLFNKSATVGSRGKLPSRFVERDNKLFFWWDDNYQLTDTAIKVYSKYNLLQDDQNGAIHVADFEINERQKSAHYYFCKSDLSHFKKVITSRGIGYYKAPNLKCSGESHNLLSP